MPTSADLVQARWDAMRSELWLVTQAEVVLNHLPQWMRADFDCSTRGAHEWLPELAGYTFCKHCNRMKRRITPCPDTQRDPLVVIYSLQFPR